MPLMPNVSIKWSFIAFALNYTICVCVMIISNWKIDATSDDDDLQTMSWLCFDNNIMTNNFSNFLPLNQSRDIFGSRNIFPYFLLLPISLLIVLKRLNILPILFFFSMVFAQIRGRRLIKKIWVIWCTMIWRTNRTVH